MDSKWEISHLEVVREVPRVGLIINSPTATRACQQRLTTFIKRIVIWFLGRACRLVCWRRNRVVAHGGTITSGMKADLSKVTVDYIYKRE